LLLENNFQLGHFHLVRYLFYGKPQFLTDLEHPEIRSLDINVKLLETLVLGYTDNDVAQLPIIFLFSPLFTSATIAISLS